MPYKYTNEPGRLLANGFDLVARAEKHRFERNRCHGFADYFSYDQCSEAKGFGPSKLLCESHAEKNKRPHYARSA